MALYKPGDVVTIVNFNRYKYYRGGVNNYMRELSGTTQIIDTVYDFPENIPGDIPDTAYYRLKNQGYVWSCEMFEESYEL